MSQADYILGVAVLGHDLSLTLVDSNGDVIVIAEEERYSRKKRGQFVFHPELAVRVLMEYGVDPSAVATFAVAGNLSSGSVNQSRILSNSTEARARHLKAWVDAFHTVFPRIRKTTHLRHHRAHAASTYFSSPWDDAAVVTVDGYGDGEVATISYGCGSSLKLLETQPFPHSLPYLYNAFARWLGLDGHEREGKLMALAAYGRPSEEERLRRILSAGNDGAWRLTNEFLDVECKSETWARVLERLLGPRRHPDDPVEPRHCDAAASIQALLEAELLATFQRAKALTGASKVCCAGGAFLNCRANGVLQLSGIFESYFFQPLASDCGLSLGAALHAASAAGRDRWRMTHARLGSDLDLENLTDVTRIAEVHCAYTSDVADVAARQLAAGSIVGWCQGRLEAGPRSLCGRSLLADPRSVDMRDRLNQIKGRERWRPFAPVMLEEETSTIFGKAIHSPHMNVAFRAISTDIIPAAVHIDGTARVQTVSRSDDPLTSRLLSRFRELTGVGALVNTSLNLRGQPIARNVHDCVAFLCEAKIDVLIVGDFVVRPTSETKPVALHSLPEWQGLPETFVLAALDPDGTLEPWISDLHKKAEALTHLALDGSFNVCPSNDIIQCVEGKNVVLLLPGYLEVCKETLPRALAWALQMESQCDGVWLADLRGKVVNAAIAFRGVNIAALASQPLSDVEIHYLRSSARKRKHSTYASR